MHVRPRLMPNLSFLTNTFGKLNTGAAVWRTAKNAYLAPPELTLTLAVSPSLEVQFASAAQALVAAAATSRK